MGGKNALYQLLNNNYHILFFDNKFHFYISLIYPVDIIASFIIKF